MQSFFEASQYMCQDFLFIFLTLTQMTDYLLPGDSNHPSTDSAHSSPNMIGATPTFYNPELESQPPTQDYLLDNCLLLTPAPSY